MNEKIQISGFDNGRKKLSDPVFTDKWNKLYHTCGWSSPYQSPEFIRTWFKFYQNIIVMLENVALN
jgi:hypothetical protein